jgi:hypothetical protein
LSPVTVVVERKPNVVSLYDRRPSNVMITELNARLARPQVQQCAVAPFQQKSGNEPKACG